jgi:hypothetical protein
MIKSCYMADPIPENSRREQNREFARRNNPRVRLENRLPEYRDLRGADPVPIYRNGLQRRMEPNEHNPPIRQVIDRELELRREALRYRHDNLYFGLGVVIISMAGIFILGLIRGGEKKEVSEPLSPDNRFYQEVLNELADHLNSSEAYIRSDLGLQRILRTLHVLRSITLEISNPVIQEKLTCFIDSTEVLISFDNPETPLPGNFYTNYVKELRDLREALSSYNVDGSNEDSELISRLIREIECDTPVVES